MATPVFWGLIPLSSTMDDATETGESITVKKSEPVLVRPAKNTPGDDYFLSNLDLYSSVIYRIIYSFKADEGKTSHTVMEVIKDALAKVLVEFYPFCGRCTIGSDGKFMVKCTGEGVPFVEGYADMGIEDLGDILFADSVKLMKLIHPICEAKDILEIPLLTMQVTRFKCGGFTVGLAVNHLMCDLQSLGEFMNSWGETARGLPLTVPPFLDRSIIRPRQHPKIEFPHHEFAEPEEEETESQEKLVHWSFCFHLQVLTQLKSIATNDSLRRCPTNFELFAALIWRYRTNALQAKPDQKVKLVLLVNVRTRINGLLPKGYFGNGCVTPSCVCNAGDLINKPISFAVNLVQETIDSVTEAYVQSSIDYVELRRSAFSSTDTCYISKVAGLRMCDADFGWGNPTQVALVSLIFDEVDYLSQGKDNDTRVVSLALPASSMNVFQKLIQSQFAPLS